MVVSQTEPTDSRVHRSANSRTFGLISGVFCGWYAVTYAHPLVGTVVAFSVADKGQRCAERVIDNLNPRRPIKVDHLSVYAVSDSQKEGQKCCDAWFLG
jgi:hypothetical protein